MPSSKHAAATPSGFSGLGLGDGLLAAVAALGYEEPTPVQRATIPLLLAGTDLLAQAATGTGKTAAFALPLIHRLAGGAAHATAVRKASARRPTRGVVLVPTRELAMQVAEAIHKYARATGLSVVPLYGGASMPQQVRALERGADIVVATPGRALDHLRRGSLDLAAVEVLVLDEADEMLDMGFAEDIETILDATPASRQTALFSATMPPRLRAISERQLRDPERVVVAAEKPAAGKLPRVRQIAYVVARAQKVSALQRVLDMENPASALVFCRTRLEVDSLVEMLNAHGYRAEALHGGMQQRQRDAVMGRFRAANADLLVATDVAARGLDIEHLSHVFNYDVPSAPEDYIHRIGRTGRAGREGTAITFAEPREHRMLRSIERMTRHRIEIGTVPTVADLRAKRLELTQAAFREQLLAGGLDQVRVVVESLAREFDILDIAAAGVKLAHATLEGDGEGDERDLPPPASGDGVRHPHPRRREPLAGATRLFVGAGRRAGVRPADLVGAIANEAGISSKDIGGIEIADAFSLVEVPDTVADRVIEAMRGAMLRGQKVTVRRERDAGGRERSARS
jgi:ATP-dependent RNA helicase DeaD